MIMIMIMYSFLEKQQLKKTWGLWPPPARHKLPAIAAHISIYTSLSLSDTQTPPPTKTVKSLPKNGILVYPLCFPYPGSSEAKKKLPIYVPPPPPPPHPFSLSPERPARVPIGQLPTLLYRDRVQTTAPRRSVVSL